jgi:hypothetical protein
MGHARFLGLAGFPLCLLFVLPISGEAPSNPAINIRIASNVKEIGEGQNVVISAQAMQTNGQPSAGVMLHAEVNGQRWGADYPTLPSGVAHLLLPLPEQGPNSLSVTNGSSHSNIVTVEVRPRRFEIVNDPNHLVILEYETWFGPGYAQWGKEEATPLLGLYSSLDPRVVRQHALWMDEMGFNAAELDWTNNLTGPFPGEGAKECIAATDLLLQVYSTMPQHPKLFFMVGPEHNLWRNAKDVYAGPWFRQQIDYLYDHYISNPKYREMFVTYEGKPLMLYYLNGPRIGLPPHLEDARFTMRYVGAWLQTTHQETYGVWSWYDQSPVPVYRRGKAEALTITDGYPSVHRSAAGLDNWLAQDAGGKNYGETYRAQWQVAMRARPQFLFINQWNEFVPPDQYNVNMSNDMEPTLLTEKGDSRASGWGFYYFDLTREKIAEYRRRIHSAQ